MGNVVDTVIQHIHKSHGLDSIMLHFANLFQFNEGNLPCCSKYLFCVCEHFINMPIALVNSFGNMYLIFFVTEIVTIGQTSSTNIFKGGITA